jgi:regulator of replication initiation timing
MQLIPLSEQEEAVLELMIENSKLKTENENLKAKVEQLTQQLEDVS